MAYTYNPANMIGTADLATLLDKYPYLKKISMDSFAQLPTMYDKICTVKSSTQKIERENSMGYGAAWSVLAEKSEFTYNDIADGTTVTYTNVCYADAVDLSWEMVRDNQWKDALAGSKMLGRGAYAARETVAATVYNNAFTAGTGADGSYLCASDHNLINSASTGDNADTVVLDSDGLKTLFVLGRKMVNEAGIYIPMMYDTLLVPPELEEIAIQLCVNEAKPGTANRDINVYAKGGEQASNYQSRIKKIIVNPYLTSTTAWFLIASMEDAKAVYFERDPITFNLERDPHTNAYLHQGRMRMVAGHTDYQAVLGSTGTGA